MYIGKHTLYIAFFDSIAISFVHSHMIALELITKGMYPSASVTISHKYPVEVVFFFFFFLTSES